MKNILLTLLIALVIINQEVAAQSPTSAAMNFNVLSKGNLTVSGGETAGPVVVGGNLTTNGDYRISMDQNSGVYKVNNAPIALAVRGGVGLNAGSMHINGSSYVKIGNCGASEGGLTPLKVWFRDGNGAASTISITKANGGYGSNPNIHINSNINTFNPKADEITNPVCENVFTSGSNQIDVEAIFAKLIARSQQLTTLADNLAIGDQAGNPIPGSEVGPYLDPSKIVSNPKIMINPSIVNVLTVSAEVWNSIGNINMERMPQGYQAGTTSYNGTFGLIINVINFPQFAASKGNTIRLPQIGGLNSGQGGLVIVNFPDATGTVIFNQDAEINGTVFAPKADLVKNGNGNINGQVIAQSFDHQKGKINFYPYLPSIPEPVEPAPPAISAEPKCIDDAPYVSYSVTGPMSRSITSAKIEWINSEGDVVKKDENQPLTGEILFPGAEVTPQGESIAYPGWHKSQGKWEPVDDENATILKPGAQIRITAGASETVDITYPTSTETCRTAPSISLPVTISGFTATKVDCNVQIKWSVTESKNFSHFVVQRSVDTQNYTSLGQVKFNESNNQYRFADSPFSTESKPSKFYYYRLQQVDLDGTTEYSSVRSIPTGTCDNRLSVDFYPNPTQEELNIKSYSAVKVVEIVTVAGKKVSRTVPAPNQTDVKVNVQGLVQGMYIVNIVNEEGKYSSKIVKK